MTYRSYLYQRITHCWQQYQNQRSITFYDIATFFRQFATLISAGIPITRACDILEHSQHKLKMRTLIIDIKRELLSGKTLSASFRRHQHHIDILICHLIQMSEYSGKLDTVLLFIAEHLEEKLAFSRRIKQALFYPALILFAGVSVTLGMLIFVIPQFADLFADMTQKLPRLTLCIFWLSDTIRLCTWPMLAAFVLSAIIFYRYQSSLAIKAKLNKLITHLPLFRACWHKVILARFARNLAITFSAGIPITDALKLSAEASGDKPFTLLIHQIIQRIRSGTQLHRAMQTSAYFPHLFIQMIKTGEESGSLDIMLEKSAAFLEADIKQLLDRLTQLLEPIIMLILGILIGSLVIGMYLPIFQLGQAI
jgi:type IV pilus assembly protein PilC